MKGAVRVATMIWSAGLLLGPTAVAAQETPPASSPPPDTVGPKALQNFSLQGNVTRPADAPADTPARTVPPARSEQPARTQPRPERRVAEESRELETKAAKLPPRPVPTATAPPPSTAEPRPLVVTPQAPAASPTSAPPSFAPAPESPPAPERRILLWPGLVALLALAAGGFLFWRSRSHRTALAGGPQLDLFTAPDPVPAPAPAPPPPQPRAVAPAPPSAPRGIVSTNLRPWIELDVRPQRCIVTEDTVTMEFELDLLNSGNAPARAIHLAAGLINAGDAQDQELANFFGRGIGPGERIPVIEPLKRFSFPTHIAVPISEVRVLEMAGRRVFVPLLAINAHYEWGAKTGHTSVAYMVGREGNAEKLTPFRLDLGPRIFRGLGVRQLPTGVRA